MLADDILRRLGQINELIRELRRPDHVGLVDVDIGVAGRQPKLVLAELVRRRRRHRHDRDLVAGLLLEDVELPAQHGKAVAGVARNDRKIGRVGRAGDENRRCEAEKRGAHVHRKTSLKKPVAMLKTGQQANAPANSRQTSPLLPRKRPDPHPSSGVGSKRFEHRFISKPHFCQAPS